MTLPVIVFNLTLDATLASPSSRPCLALPPPPDVLCPQPLSLGSAGRQTQLSPSMASSHLCHLG